MRELPVMSKQAEVVKPTDDKPNMSDSSFYNQTNLADRANQIHLRRPETAQAHLPKFEVTNDTLAKAGQALANGASWVAQHGMLGPVGLAAAGGYELAQKHMPNADERSRIASAAGVSVSEMAKGAWEEARNNPGKLATEAAIGIGTAVGTVAIGAAIAAAAPEVALVAGVATVAVAGGLAVKGLYDTVKDANHDLKVLGHPEKYSAQERLNAKTEMQAFGAGLVHGATDIPAIATGGLGVGMAVKGAMRTAEKHAPGIIKSVAQDFDAMEKLKDPQKIIDYARGFARRYGEHARDNIEYGLKRGLIEADKMKYWSIGLYREGK